MALPPRCRYTRAAVKAVADGASADAPQETLLVVMGEKGRSQLQRDMRAEIYATIAGGCWAGAGIALPSAGGCCWRQRSGAACNVA